MTGRVKRCRAFHYALKSSSVLKISQQLTRSRAKIQNARTFYTGNFFSLRLCKGYRLLQNRQSRQRGGGLRHQHKSAARRTLSSPASLTAADFQAFIIHETCLL